MLDGQFGVSPQMESSVVREAVVPTVARIREIVRDTAPSSEQLADVAELLKNLAMSPMWLDAPFRAALPGEELVYELAVAPGVPSLYLVSDGVGTSSPPHRHETWALIAGVRGRESNVEFRVIDIAERLVAPVKAVTIGPGETLILTRESIHATEVAGSEATFHLHLYGCPLHELPNFELRRYRVVPAA